MGNCIEGSNPSLSARDNMFDILYKFEGTQFNELTLSQPLLPLETICQLDNCCEYEFNVVNNFNITQIKNNNIIVPIDYQSTPLSHEGRNTYFGPTELGTRVEEFLQEVYNLNLTDKNVIIILYTSTEPFFHDNHLFIESISNKFNTFKFVCSGSGEVKNLLSENKLRFDNCKNVSLISKLWYVDRVQYNTQLIYPDQWLNRHFNNSEKEPSSDIPEYATVYNKFLLTMRNARSHRVLMSMLLESDPFGLENVRYSRLWSLDPGYLNSIYFDEDTRSEHRYQVDLVTTAIKELVKEKLNDKILADTLKVTYKTPHKLDMKTIAEVGHPPKWLYDNIDIAIISGGEGSGWGYVDEKQLIPMYYKVPFITFGCKGIYEEMEKLGFKTYGDHWDISFNTKELLYDRVAGCYELMNTIKELPQDEYTTLIENTKDDVEFNYNHLTSSDFRHVSNNNFFGEVINACC